MRLKEIASGIPLVIGRNRKKPSAAEMRTLTDLNQRIYKAKRKAVSNAALEKWPGNNLPVFKNDPAATKELETLVSTLEETCSFEAAGFNREGIHQHILDVLNERRRRIRKGHDYTKPDKRTIKKLKVSSSSSELEASGAEDEGGDTDILSSSSSDKDESYENEEDLSLQGAKLIITVMFSAIKYADVSKQQLLSGAKKFKLSCNTSSKDSMALALAKTFVKENFIKINSPNLRDFTRDKVQKLKVY
ncbi:uncharacterized protein [Montipora capricornis]|uniref:uncharacterized protein n=1 Tax=Montipora capricornis TaxID=246305 RepID=UPI0035F13128